LYVNAPESEARIVNTTVPLAVIPETDTDRTVNADPTCGESFGHPAAEPDATSVSLVGFAVPLMDSAESGTDPSEL
jgi:hypothetical protein